MKSGSSSQTAMIVAMPRAIHQLIDSEPRILDDPVAVHMVPGFSRENVLATLNAPNPILDYRSPMMTLARANLIMRARFTEDCLREAINAGVRQYVILGAGFDTFAYRQPSWGRKLRVFEVDHPATQRIKRNRLSTAGIKVPGNLAYCGCDFERTVT
jgi:methyltransferase (TIGR00027 family)